MGPLSGAREKLPMIREKVLPEDIEARLDVLPGVLAGYPEVVFVYLFGSLAEGRRAPLSDADIAVFLREKEDAEVCRERLLAAAIECLGTEEIDLVVLNGAPISLLGRVLQTRRVLLDNDPFARHRFESRAIREYLDFHVFERHLLDRRFRGRS